MRAHASIAALCWVLFVALACPGLANDADRDQWLQPDKVMAVVGVKPGMVIGEVGAGKGYFTVKLARAVGPGGRVYANDIDEGALEQLAQRCRTDGIHNVVTVVGQDADPGLPAGKLEQVWFVYSLHDVDEPVALLRNLKSSLAPGATVVVLDQDPERTGSNHFLPTEQIREIFSDAGYRPVKSYEIDLERDLLLGFLVAGIPGTVH